MDGYQEYVFDDDGVLHKVVSMEIYFTSEEERAKFEKAMKEGTYKRVTKCVDCKNWGDRGFEFHRCLITGAYTQHDDYCSRGEEDGDKSEID